MAEHRPPPGNLHFIPPADALDERSCGICGARFALRYAFQQVALRGATLNVCSQACRAKALDASRVAAPRTKEPIRIAVLNQKGGTGKTTTAVNLSAGLAESGKRVLLIDTDAQGHVSVSLGVRGERSLYHIIVEGADAASCAVPVADGLDVVTSNATLASAEIYLARLNEGRDRVLRTRLASATNHDFVVLDCGPSLSVLNMNALSYADYVVIPVSCDFLSLVGVRQVLKTIKHVNELLLHPVEVLGVLPTFYDQRNRISDESVKTLQGQFHDKVIPPIRINTRLKEAPSHGQTIFQYAPDSRGAEDYRRAVGWILDRLERAPRHTHGKESSGTGG